jgi:hypothetical protein
MLMKTPEEALSRKLSAALPEITGAVLVQVSCEELGFVMLTVGGVALQVNVLELTPTVTPV